MTEKKVKQERKNTHDRLLQDCFTWAWNSYPESRYSLFHVANELAPFPGEAQQSFVRRLGRLKAVGVLPGVLDFIFYWRGCQYALDAKLPGDTLSNHQLRFITQLEAHNGRAATFETLAEFQQIFTAIVEQKA